MISKKQKPNYNEPGNNISKPNKDQWHMPKQFFYEIQDRFRLLEIQIDNNVPSIHSPINELHRMVHQNQNHIPEYVRKSDKNKRE